MRLAELSEVSRERTPVFARGNGAFPAGAAPEFRLFATSLEFELLEFFFALVLTVEIIGYPLSWASMVAISFKTFALVRLPNPAAVRD